MFNEINVNVKRSGFAIVAGKQSDFLKQGTITDSTLHRACTVGLKTEMAVIIKCVTCSLDEIMPVKTRAIQRKA